MKAVFLDYATMGGGLDAAPLRAVVDELVIHDMSTSDEVPARIADADAVLTNKIVLTPELIAAAPSLKFIGLTATGTDNIDLEAAREYGIAVANISDYCTASVVEHVFGTLLMLTHSLPLFRQSVQDGFWQESDNPFLLNHPVRELTAMTLGLVGYGTLGKGVAATAAAFGMDVIVSARRGSGDLPDGRVPFPEVLSRSDVISLHCPLNDETRNMIGANELRQMKDSAILINTARGGLVDSKALVDALRDGIIAAASIDVLPQEPPVDGDPLLDYDGDNLIVTPHIAWASQEARQNAIVELAANIRAFANGERRNRVV